MTPRTPRVFFGWWMAGAFAVMVFVSTGIRFAVGPFLEPVVADLGIDRLLVPVAMWLILTVGLFGTIFLVHQAGAAAGSWLGGLLFELTGGYGVAFGWPAPSSWSPPS